MQNFTNFWTRAKTGVTLVVNGLKSVVLGLSQLGLGLLNLIWVGEAPVIKRSRKKSR
jgi:hypothetical protein